MNKYKRQLTFIDIVLSTIGYVVGAGIFAVIGIASKYGKDYTWISVIICIILAISTGLSYSELSSIYNKNGGEYFYVKESFNNDTFSKIIAYFIIIVEILSVTAVAFGLGGYLKNIINIPSIVYAAISLIGFGYINYSGLRNSMNYSNIITIVEVLGLIVISLGGINTIGNTKFNVGNITTSQIQPIILGAAYIYFAFFGYDIIIELSEETKNPEKNIPYGMLTGIIVSAVLYLMVTLSAVSSIGWKALSQTESPITEVANKLLGSKFGSIITFIAIISMTNTILMGHVGTSRFVQSMAKELKIPYNLEKIDKKTNTPKNAIIIITVLTLMCLCFGNLENVLSFGNIGTLFLFFIINICVIVLRVKKPTIKRPFKIKGTIQNVPMTSIVGAVGSLILGFVLIKSKI